MLLLMTLIYAAIFIILFCVAVNKNFLPQLVDLFKEKLSKSMVTDDVWNIPGPKNIPFIGTKWVFFWKYKLIKLHEAYADMRKKYGPIFLEVTSTGIPIVSLFAREDIEKVLRYPSKYPFRPPTDIVIHYRSTRPDLYASAGIVNEQGERWHNLRINLTPYITSPRSLITFLPELTNICDDFIDLLLTKRDPRTFIVDDFSEITNLFGLEAVSCLMLGRRMGFLSLEPNEKAKKLANAVKQLFVSIRDSYYGIGIWKYLPTKTYRQFSESEEVIYSIISEIVDQALLEDELNSSDDHVRGIFHNILLTNLDIRDKKSAIIDFIAAGIETLANTFTFVLYYTTKKKSVQERIYKEFEGCGQQITHDQLVKANYTKACLQETYRIKPTAICLARILEESTVLSGYTLKPGTVVLCQTMIASNDNANFKDAKDFIPERWLAQNNNNNSTNNELVSSRIDSGAAGLVVPFGIGKRTCPGKRFVEMELTILLAKLISKFDIEFIDDELKTEFEFLLAPKTPVNIKLRDRC